MMARGSQLNLTLGSLFSRHRRRVLEYLVLTALATAPLVAAGRVVQWAIDEVTRGRSPILPMTIVVTLLAITSYALYSGLARSIGRLTRETRADADGRVLSGLLARAVSQPLEVQSGGAEFAAYGRMFSGLLITATQGFPLVVSGVGLALGVWVIAPPLANIAVLSVVLASALAVVAIRILNPVQEALLESSEVSSSTLAEGMEAVRDVVAFGAEGLVLDRAGGAFEEERSLALDLARRSAVVSTLSGAVAVVVSGLMIWRGTALRSDGVLSLGQAVAGISQGVAAQAALSQLALWVSQLVVRARALNARLEVRTSPPPPLRREPASGDSDLHVDDLAFTWGATAIVDGLTLSLPVGDHIAIVGPSGVGKSTLAGLLCGALDPNRGSVRLGGVDVRTHPSAQTMIAVLPQESYVFAGTLRENLSILAPSVHEDASRAAAEIVGLARVVDRLGGLDAEISPRTSGLSSGEQQLIALTRVYLSDASVLILDEATCYLDPVAESTAEEALMARPSTTLIVIAHRLSSARRASRILVLDGSTAEVGTHEELLGANRLYKELSGHWAAPDAPVGQP